MKKRRIEVPVQTEAEEKRNWVDLPYDIMILIFSKLDILEILFCAQFVCSYWFHLAKDRSLYRSLIFIEYRKFNIEVLLEALDRSHGETTEISLGEGWCVDSVLSLVSQKLNCLTSLLLENSHESFPRHYNLTILNQVSGKVPLLEKLEFGINIGSNLLEIIPVFGRSCPNLKHFQLNNPGGCTSIGGCDKVVASIAENMPGLRSLILPLKEVSKEGFSLEAVVDGCQHLAQLDLRGCRYGDLNLDKKWLQKCADRLIDLKLPSRKTRYKRLQHWNSLIYKQGDTYVYVRSYIKKTKSTRKRNIFL